MSLLYPEFYRRSIIKFYCSVMTIGELSLSFQMIVEPWSWSASEVIPELSIIL